MRYRLRTLLIIVAAVVPAVIAAAWCLLAFGNPALLRALMASRRAHMSDSAIRQELLAATPPGTSAADVIAYVDAKLGRNNWLRPFDASSGRTSPLGRPSGSAIEVIVGERSTGVRRAELVKAIWHINHEERVLDISIERFSVGPPASEAAKLKQQPALSFSSPGIEEASQKSKELGAPQPKPLPPGPGEKPTDNRP